MEGIERREVEKVPYTFALNDPSTCTSEILVVPKNCNVGLPRILSSANASGFSSRFSLDFPLGVDVTVEFPRSPETDDAESRVRVKLRPSRTMYESGSSSEPRYSRRWFIAVDVDAFDASVNILEVHGWSKAEVKGGQASKCLAGEGCSCGAGCRDCRRTTCPVADLTKCLTRSHDRVRRVSTTIHHDIVDFGFPTTLPVEITADVYFIERSPRRGERNFSLSTGFDISPDVWTGLRLSSLDG